MAENYVSIDLFAMDKSNILENNPNFAYTQINLPFKLIDKKRKNLDLNKCPIVFEDASYSVRFKLSVEALLRDIYLQAWHEERQIINRILDRKKDLKQQDISEINHLNQNTKLANVSLLNLHPNLDTNAISIDKNISPLAQETDAPFSTLDSANTTNQQVFEGLDTDTCSSPLSICQLSNFTNDLSFNTDSTDTLSNTDSIYSSNVDNTQNSMETAFDNKANFTQNADPFPSTSCDLKQPLINSSSCIKDKDLDLSHLNSLSVTENTKNLNDDINTQPISLVERAIILANEELKKFSEN